MNILVTGMSGLIGGAIQRQLEGTHSLRALNRRDVEGVPCIQADIADFDAMRPAFDDVDTVVHLAAAIHGDWDAMLPNNVIGTYNVFEASRQAGVKRVIYASSGSVVAGWEREEPYRTLVAGDVSAAPESWEPLTHETPTRPVGLYGCTKVWGEALARHYADSNDLSVICLRIGAVNAEDQPLQPRHESVYCSQQNIACLVEACIDAPPSLKFDIFYGVSKNPLNYRDTEHARQVLGFDSMGSSR